MAVSEVKITGIEKPKFRHLWSIDSFDVSRFNGIDEKEIYHLFSEQRKKFYSGESALFYPNGIKPDERVVKKNRIVKGFYETILKLVGNGNLDMVFGGNDGAARYIAVGVRNTETIAASMTQLVKEIGRLSISERYFSGTTLELSTFFEREAGNGHKTLVVDDVGNSTTEFKVALLTSSSGTFEVGDRIRVTTTSQFNFVNITAIDTVNNIITIDTAMPDIPLEDQEVIHCWAECGVFGNNTANGNPNTGTMFNRLAGTQNSNIDYAKDNTKIATVRVNLIGVL